ncbi:hypothetical protein [Pseudomonas aeruginosa]|uniref:hypothetical protein n=1 Tax=Pseudomonas aeruginosa TaxID=287 RepID=UPI000AF68887|nr:hypothetical protein [Pseudomonas aeruginosa]
MKINDMRDKCRFCIGTHFTCDLPGVEPMNIVVKMSACNGHPVAKISDTPGKAQCRDPDFIHYLKHVFQVAEGKPGAPRQGGA